MTRSVVLVRAATAALATIALAALALPGGAAAERKRGIDVSRFQGRIDWERVGDTQVEFAFLQASRGSGADCAVEPTRCGPDEFYDRNYERARANGIRVGPYHRAFTGGEGRLGIKRDSRREAKVFLAEVGDLEGRDLRPVLDVETPFDDLASEELRMWVRNWLTKVEKELGSKPIIYTNFSSWAATGDTTAFARRGHPLWVANFDVEKPKVPALDWNGLGWSVWQFTNSGHVQGISGNVDENLARVSLNSLSVRGGPGR